MPQAMQSLLVDWLERYSSLLEPTDMETALRDEVDMALASILAAGMASPSPSVLRMLRSAQTTKLTAARVCLIQSMFVHGE